jgi:phage-related protein
MSGSLTFPAPYGPTFGGSSKKTSARVRKTDFGDGYGQRVTDGLNALRDEWSVSWDALTESEAATMDAFLRARLGTQFFLWAPPGETLAKKWICAEWTVSPVDAGAYSLSATFTQVFDL